MEEEWGVGLECEVEWEWGVVWEWSGTGGVRSEARVGLEEWRYVGSERVV